MSEWNYLRSFSRLLEQTEVPPRFTVWCGIASILAALERRIWINQGVYSIYPNFYMVMVAASGQKKSTSINTAARLLRRLEPGPNVISQKITPEALIASIQLNTHTTKELMKKKCGGIVVADELATFLDRQSLERGLGPILTALYDCTPFEYQTMKRGAERVEEGYLSILGGSTIELLKNSLPKDAIGGGFTSRTLFVYEDRVPPPVPWIEYSEEMTEIEDQCVSYLQRLMVLEGAVTLTKDAKELFIRDYKERHSAGIFRNDSLLRSYENRRHAHLLKVAMALMVAEEPRMVMEAQHVMGAKVILEEAEEYLPRVVELIAASETGMQGQMILETIRNRDDGMTRAELVRRFGNVLDSQEISKALDTLIIGRRLICDTKDGRLIYRVPKAMESFTR